MNRSMTHKTLLAGIMAALLGTAVNAIAAVSAEEAAKLKTTLTPLGGERAGNAEGTIPEWTGGYTTVDPNYKKGGKRGNPFKDEKPLFTITAANMAEHGDKLTKGIKAMLQKYPDSYRLDVYPTHRSAVAPERVYKKTFENATTVDLTEGAAGLMPGQEGAGGIPFPIPQNGAEAMWNHLLRWRGASWHQDFSQYLTTTDGKHVLTNDSRAKGQMPWYLPDPVDNGVFWQLSMVNEGPPLRAGEAIVGYESIDPSRNTSWTYLPGQRRVRRLPNACCDTPTPATAGVMSFDELSVFGGRLDRFNWKIAGKKEIYIPYNTNSVLTAENPKALLTDHHLNPDHIRWELHRVWVIEATLKEGKRHQMPRSTYYLDEDTWAAVLGERYDAKEQLSKVLWTTPVVMPDLPGVVTTTSGFYDMISGAWFAGDIYAGKSEQYRIVDHYPQSDFTPDAMVGSGLR